MKRRYKDAVETRSLYKFENEYFSGHKICKMRSMSTLRRMAKRIMKNPPRIVAHRGEYYGGRYLSYQCDDGIFLARNQREYLTLTHELVHAMGYDYHDYAFVKKYFSLLTKVFRLNKQDLVTAARKYGVSI